MLTAKELFELAHADAADPMTRGRLMALRRRASHKQQLYIGQLLETPPRKSESSYRSPLDVPFSQRSADKAPFSPSDVAWLQRLANEPDQLSDDAVTQLLQLEAQAEPKSGDDRLIKSVLGPVRSHHERERAKAMLRDARAHKPVVPAPGQLATLAAEAMAADHSELSAGELERRARHEIDSAIAQREQAHARRLEDAKALRDATKPASTSAA